MKTLIIYDNDGVVYFNVSHYYNLPNGLPYIEIEVPEGKIITGVDVSITPHQVILEDIPKSETELLKEENTALKLAVAELAEVYEQQKLEMQLALAELAESLGGN